jgi:hypothetical protein
VDKILNLPAAAEVCTITTAKSRLAARHSGARSEPVIGPRFARTRWREPGIPRPYLLLDSGSACFARIPE